MTAAPLLVLGVGNPSRGDDALGPRFVEAAAAALADEIAAGRLELLTDFQLQIEHALDLTGRQRVVFVDASVAAAPPFELTRVAAAPAPGVTSHAMSPAAVLETHRAVVGEPPEAWVLAIRGERFELGDELSPSARAHLDAALAYFVRTTRAGATATEVATELAGVTITAAAAAGPPGPAAPPHRAAGAAGPPEVAMHEVSLVHALFDQADRALGPHPASAVRQVRVRIGELAGVDPELFATAFAGCRDERGYGAAELEVQAEAATWRCRGCGATVAAGAELRCATCADGGDPTLIAGGDLFLDRLELEVRDG